MKNVGHTSFAEESSHSPQQVCILTWVMSVKKDATLLEQDGRLLSFTPAP